MMEEKREPAKINYFFGPGWNKLGRFISKLWKKNCDTAKGYFNSYKENLEEENRLFLSAIKSLICAISVVMYGTIFFVFYSAVIGGILSAFFIIVYIGFILIWTIDRLYLHMNKIFMACPSCKTKALIPYYQCECGRMHKNLTPGKYGILYRKCECGKKLGACFLTGRKQYKAFCPACLSPLSDSENRLICIPVVGGRSVGKTAFITAFSNEFIEKLAPKNGWTTRMYDAEKERIYKEIKNDYQSGNTRMTVCPQGNDIPSATSVSFFLKGEEFNVERLVHIYDVAGEIFKDNTENEVQLQYTYCHGIVLIIDPFSIPSVANRYARGLSSADIAGMSQVNVLDILDAFYNKLREVTGMSVSKQSSIPIAVVISKMDAPELEKRLGTQAVQCLKEELRTEGIEVSDMDAQDLLCRSFLAENDMQNFLNSIDFKFKNNRFFACAAIGHSRGLGTFRPQGVMEPMEWLFRNADSAMNKKWSDHKFGNKIPVKEVH